MEKTIKAAKEFRERGKMRADANVQLAKNNLLYWDQMLIHEAIELMEEDEQLLTRKNSANEHAAWIAEQKRTAIRLENHLKIFGAFIVGLMVAGCIAVIISIN